jgi:hypothetical protein
MGVPTSDVGYTSATTGKGDHEVHKGHVVALAHKKCSNVNYTEQKSLIFKQYQYYDRSWYDAVYFR